MHKLQDTTFPLYVEINKNMEAMTPSPFVEKSADGVELVNKSEGRYAFFMESVSIEYQTERECALTQLGGLLDNKGYGIGMKKGNNCYSSICKARPIISCHICHAVLILGSRFRDAFTTQVLNLSETGEIEQLKKKWWKTEGGGKCAQETVSAGGAQAITIRQVGGVFVVLLGGCILSILMAFIEFLWKSRKLALRGGVSF